MEKNTFTAPEAEIIRYNEEALTTAGVGASISGGGGQPGEGGSF
ncbi:MAG: hypothetical protein ACOYBC_10015 [Bilifractor sp.]|jgi:hypothetical protein